MNNIYRRQPVQHKLPTGFEDLDNVKFLSINNINGLQVYDNPLVADQNSTHDCKNVYRDELGNLTVRPAIWYDVSNSANNYLKAHNNVRWYKKTSFGLFVIEQSGDNDTIVFTDTNIELAILKDSNVACNETEDGIYFLIQEPVEGSLQLHRFFKSEDSYSVEQVTGEIQLNDNINPNINLYNILNDKIYSPQTVINSDDKFNKYNTTAEIIANESISLNSIIKILKYSEGLALFYRMNDEIKVILFIDSGLITNITIGTYAEYEYANEQFCIKDYFDGKYFDVTLVYKSDNEIRIAEITISYTGTVTVVNDVKAINKSHSGKIFMEVFPLYDGYYLGGELNTLSNGFYPVTLSVCKAGKVITTFSEIYYKDNANDEILFAVAPTDTNIFIVSITKNYKNVSSWTADYNVYEYSKSTKIDSGVYSSAQLAWRVSNARVESFQNFCLLQLANYSSSDFTDDEHFAAIKLCIDKKSPDMQYLIDTDAANINASTVASSSATLYLYDDTMEYASIVYSIGESTDTVKKYYFESGPALVFGDWVLSLDNATRYYKREVQGTNTPLSRPTDRIPVLSQFKESIITSFYLDGYYWFVTQKHIFGTGAANGQLTIEFFDPMKYYAVTESLTAAMRVSDTSFWVFHNDGAYLIYKASASNDNGSYYVWLCTNTAKSKGCDFLNAIVTLPVSSNIAVVTSEDICSVEMKENIQSDDRTLVPMTMNFREMIRDLLNYTSDIVIVNHRYLTIFFLNRESANGSLPAIIFDNSINSWWYWEFPVDRIYQATQMETNAELLLEHNNTRVLYRFSEELYTKRVGSIDYEIYTDKLKTVKFTNKYATVNLMPNDYGDGDKNLSAVTSFSEIPGIIYNNPETSSVKQVQLRNFAGAFEGITTGTKRFRAIRTLTASGRETSDFSFADIYLYDQPTGKKYPLFKSDIFDKVNFDFEFEVTEDTLGYQMYMEMGRNLGKVKYTNIEVDWTEVKEEPEEIVQIDWEWESAILLFGTTDFRKQLLFTTFTFDDYFDSDNHLTDKSFVNFEFYFKIYSRRYATTSPQVTSTSVERVTNNACRTMIGNFNYLQMVLRNRKFEDDDEGYSALIKPKICNISLKYRILRGTLT